MVRAAFRRLAVVFAATAVGVSLVSLVLGLLLDSTPNRSISTGLYVAGSLVLVGGFFMGNRGPLRVTGDGSDMPFLFFFGTRRVHWATKEEQQEALNASALYILVGLALLALAVAVDERFRLF